MICLLGCFLQSYQSVHCPCRHGTCLNKEAFGNARLQPAALIDHSCANVNYACRFQITAALPSLQYEKLCIRFTPTGASSSVTCAAELLDGKTVACQPPLVPSDWFAGSRSHCEALVELSGDGRFWTSTQQNVTFYGNATQKLWKHFVLCKFLVFKCHEFAFRRRWCYFADLTCAQVSPSTVTLGDGGREISLTVRGVHCQQQLRWVSSQHLYQNDACGLYFPFYIDDFFNPYAD